MEPRKIVLINEVDDVKGRILVFEPFCDGTVPEWRVELTEEEFIEFAAIVTAESARIKHRRQWRPKRAAHCSLCLREMNNDRPISARLFGGKPV